MSLVPPGARPVTAPGVTVSVSHTARLRGALRSLIRRPGFWAVALLLLLPFALFWPVWWPGAGGHKVFAYGDFVEQYYPMRAFVSGEWRAFRLPLWDPYTYAGTPAAAASLFAAFYPLGLWQALFSHPFPFAALELEAIFHLGLAGVFTFLFVRRITGSGAAGLISGVAFSLGGFLTSYPVVQLGILETAIWLPLGLWLTEIGLTRCDLRWLALAGLALACGFLAGHPQTFLYIAYTVAAYFAYRVWRLRLSWRYAIKAAFVMGLVVIGVSAIQWLPSAELARLSPRASLSYEAVSNGFTPAELWGLLRPNPGQWSPLYIGLLPLALVMAGLLGRKRVDAWFWLGLTVVALLLALGRNGFLYPFAHGVVPGFASFRNQERAAYVVSFSLAVCAGYGWATLVGLRAWPRYAVWGVTGLLVVLTFADLYRANFGLILEPAPEGGYFPRTDTVYRLQTTGSPDWRTSTEGLLPGDGNAGLVFRLRDVSGNSPLHLADYDRFLAQVPEQRFWQLLNVQHLLTQRQLDHGALKEVLAESDRRLYQVFVNARPAWIVHDYRRAANVDAALAQTADPNLDPYATAVLEDDPGFAPGPATGDEQATLARFGPQRMAYDVQLTSLGLLVASEVAYPGWKVYVDGKPAESLRAYGLLRAVALPAGTYRVEWRYEPLTVTAGLLLCLATLATVGWLTVRRRKDL